MNGIKDKVFFISLFVCGLSLLGVIIGMIAHLSDPFIRICGTVMLVAMIVLVYKITRFQKSKN